MQNSKQNPKLSEAEIYCFLLEQILKQNQKVLFILQNIQKIITSINEIQATWDKMEQTIIQQINE